MGAQKTNGQIDKFINELSDLTKRVSYPDKISVDRSHDVYNEIVEKVAEFFAADRACLAYVDHKTPTNIHRLYGYNYGTEESPGWWQRLSREQTPGQVALSLKAEKGVYFEHNIKQEMANYVAIHEDSQAQATLTVSGKEKKSDTVVFIFEFRGAISEESESRIRDSWERIQRLLSRFEEHIFFCRGQHVLDKLISIGQSREESTALDRILELAMSITGNGEAAILKRYGSRLDVLDARGINKEDIPDYIDINTDVGSGYTAYVAFTRDSFPCRDTQDEHIYPNYKTVDTNTRSQYTIPLLYRSELVGVLNIGNDRPYTFSHLDLQLMEAIARHAAYVLYNIGSGADDDSLATGIRSSLSPWRSWNKQIISNLKRSGMNTDIVEHVDESISTANELAANLNPVLVQEEKTIDLEKWIKPQVRRLESKTDEENFELAWANKLLKAPQSLTVHMSSDHFIEIVGHLTDIALIEVRGDKKEYVQVELDVAPHPEKKDVVSYIFLRFVLGHPNNHLKRLSSQIDYPNLFNPVMNEPQSQFLQDAQLKLWRCDRLLAAYGGFLGIRFDEANSRTLLEAFLKPHAIAPGNE